MDKLNNYQKKLVQDFLKNGYSNLDSCIYAVVKITKDSELYDDFCGVAEEGLIKAALRFNPDKNMKFSSFAMMTVKNALKTYLTYLNRKKRKNEVADISLDSLLGDEEDLMLSEVLSDDTDFERQLILNTLVDEILKEMNAFEKQVTLLMMRGYSDKEIAHQLRRLEQEIKNAKQIYKSTKILIAGQALLKNLMMGEY